MVLIREYAAALQLTLIPFFHPFLDSMLIKMILATHPNHVKITAFIVDGSN
jgi:hypothetical protein